MWRGKDVVCNILGHLVFVVPNELLVVAYRELPSGGYSLPPRTPPRQGGHTPLHHHHQHGGGAAPPPSSPPAVRVYQACELFVKS